MVMVIKRDGRKVNFNRDKIQRAVELAIRSAGGEEQYSATEQDHLFAEDLSKAIEKQVKNKEEVTIQEIQTMVERKLMASKRKDVAQKYIEYRHWRDQQREKTGIDKFITDVIDLNNLENENANMDENVFTAKKERIASEVLRQHAMKYLLSPAIRKAYEDNLVYIHDFNSYSIGMHNCTLLDLGDILRKGFTTQNGDVRPPKSISSAMQLTAVILQCVSNEQFGGVAVSNIDYDLAPYVAMSFEKIYKRNLSVFEDVIDIEEMLSDVEIKLGNEDLSKRPVMRKAYELSVKQLEKETYQAAEGLIHNLNTLQSRSGN